MSLKTRKVKDIVEELYATYNVVIPGHLEYNIVRGPEDVYVDVNRSSMMQVMSNLVNNAVKFTKEGVSNIRTIKMRFGIGKTRATAKWYNGNNGWSSTPTDFYGHVGFGDGKWRFGYILNGTHVYLTENINCIESAAGKEGKVFIDIYSTNDFDIDGWPDSQEIDITGFALTYQRVVVDYIGGEMVYGDMLSRREYTAKNGNMSRAEWNNDVIYASGKIDSDFGFGLVFKTDNRPMSTASYASGDQEPEQHQANRVANYWASTRRMIRANLRSNEVPLISPGMFLTIDGTRCYPLSISHEWRDDVINVSLIEIPT